MAICAFISVNFDFRSSMISSNADRRRLTVDRDYHAARERSKELRSAVVGLRSLFKHSIYKIFSIEFSEVVNAFACADELDRQTQFFRNRKDDAAFRRAIEFRQN